MATRVSIYLEQEILSATGLQLVHLLYQAAMTELRDARTNLSQKDVAARCRNISKACEMIGELRGSLNFDAGGEIAQQLGELYGYMLCRLLDANMQKDDGALAEVLGLLSTLDEAWKALAHEPQHEIAEGGSEGTPYDSYSLAETADSLTHAWSL